MVTMQDRVLDQIEAITTKYDLILGRQMQYANSGILYIQHPDFTPVATVAFNVDTSRVRFEITLDHTKNVTQVYGGPRSDTRFWFHFAEVDEINRLFAKIEQLCKASSVNPQLQLEKALTALIGQGLTLSSAIRLFSIHHASDESAAYITAAREKWVSEGSVEIDDHTVTSGSDDDGDYVLAWVWVTNADAGLADSDD